MKPKWRSPSFDNFSSYNEKLLTLETIIQTNIKSESKYTEYKKSLEEVIELLENDILPSARKLGDEEQISASIKEIISRSFWPPVEVIEIKLTNFYMMYSWQERFQNFNYENAKKAASKAISYGEKYQDYEELKEKYQFFKNRCYMHGLIERD